MSEQLDRIEELLKWIAAQVHPGYIACTGCPLHPEGQK